MTFHVPGTLTANITPVFTAPADCTLLEVSAVASNASSGQIKIGTTSDDDAYLALADIGDSNVPAVFTRTNFVGTQYPRISDGDVVLVTVDYDGAAGTAAQNLSVMLTLAEG